MSLLLVVTAITAEEASLMELGFVRIVETRCVRKTGAKVSLIINN